MIPALWADQHWETVSAVGRSALGDGQRWGTVSAGGWSAPTAPTGAGLLTSTVGLQKLSDIIQVGWATPRTQTARSCWKWGVTSSSSHCP